MEALRKKKQRRTEKDMQTDRNNKGNDEDAATGEERKSNLRIGMVVLHGAAGKKRTSQGIEGTEKKKGVALAAPILALAACSRGSASN